MSEAFFHDGALSATFLFEINEPGGPAMNIGWFNEVSGLEV